MEFHRSGPGFRFIVAIFTFLLLFVAAEARESLQTQKTGKSSSVFSLFNLKEKSRFWTDSVIHSSFDDLESSSSGKMGSLNYTRAGNIASYLMLQEVESMYLPVPVNFIFIGFEGKGNQEFKLHPEELERWFTKIDHIFEHTRVPKVGEVLTPFYKIHVDRERSPHFPLISHINYNFSVHAIQMGEKVTSIFEHAIKVLARKDDVSDNRDDKDVLWQVDVDLMDALFTSLVDHLELGDAYNIFILNAKHDLKRAKYGYRRGLSDSEITFLKENRSLQTKILQSGSISDSVFAALDKIRKPLHEKHPMVKFAWTITDETDTVEWYNICMNALNNAESLYHGNDTSDIIQNKVSQLLKGKNEDMKLLLEKELKSGDFGDFHAECLTDTWIGKDRWAFIDLTAGPFSWGPAVGGEGVRTELSLPNVEKTIGAVAEISDDEAEERLQEAIQEKFSVFGDKEHQAIDILLAEIDIYELFAFKHCKGRRVKLALCEELDERMRDLKNELQSLDGEEYDESHRRKAIEALKRMESWNLFSDTHELEFRNYTVARDTFLAHLGATLWGSMRHIISPSLSDGAFHYYEKISFQLFFITQEKVRSSKHLPIDLMALKNGLSSLLVSSQKAMFSETLLVLSEDPALAMAFSVARRAAAVPILLVNGTYRKTTRSYLDSSILQHQLQRQLQEHGSLKVLVLLSSWYISVRTTTLAEDCVLAKMVKLVEEAQNRKSKTQRLIDQCAQYYTPAVVIISASFAVVPFALRFHNLNHWLHFALVVLVSACPCALILSTPVAAFCALTKAAKAGVLIKGGDSLEKLAKIKAMAFDKTGTITTGEFVVTDFQSFNDDIDFNTLLSWVSSIESKSSHPVAAALIDHARSNAIEPKPDNVEGFQNFPGKGVQGKIDGKDIYIGNRKIAYRAGSGAVPTMEDDIKSGKTVGYVYCGTTHAGIFHLSDRCRTGVAESIKKLKLLGIKTVMLTGDNEAAAMYAQEKLEHALEEVHAQLLPEDKVTIIRELKKKVLTAMVGDGINDAPALATADIGISMGISGSALATETGNVILLSNDLRKVPKAIQIAKKAHRKIIENILLSISTKCIILALAIAGHPLVWAAVLADVATCVLVIFNSMLLLQDTDNHARNHCNASAAQLPNQHCSKNQPKPCCSIQKVEKAQCDSQGTKYASRCQSSHLTVSSCRNKNCTDSAESHAKCVVANTKGFDEAEHCDQGSCKTDIYYDIEANTTLSQCCSGRQNQRTCSRQTCERSVETEVICAEGDDLLCPLLASEVSTLDR